MTRIEYLTQLEELLKQARMAPRDLEDALGRCDQFILNAGPEKEEETIAGMAPPEQMAQEILDDYRGTLNAKGHKSYLGRKILLGLLLSPFIIAAYAVVAGLVAGGVACILPGAVSIAVGVGSILSGGLATLLVFLGGGFAALGAGLLLLLGGIALCQGSNWCMGRLFGGRRART